jgi:hypothetical protein
MPNTVARALRNFEEMRRIQFLHPAPRAEGVAASHNFVAPN